MESPVEPTLVHDDKQEQEHEISRSSMHHDSMVTVRLSEPPALHLNTTLPTSASEAHKNDSEIFSGKDTPNIILEEVEEGPAAEEGSPRITMMDPNGNEVLSPSGSESAHSPDNDSRRGSDSSDASGEDSGVNWEELEKTEEQEPRSESSDDSTALLLARLEQENNLLATNPKSGIAKVQPREKPRPRQSRPPSIQHLKRLVNGPTPSALRYSMLPAPAMTDLEFYAALVQDYTRTAQCLPTLLSKKIRNGIPPPLRGVVWQSMSGARDPLLEDQFDRLCGESSPYEGIIGKDLGRSFPGVEMFRDPEGDGQRMLGKVLKCFSLYDHKIGYCQGLGFLVGPLLMHMGDKQAFCVLVRLMEHYDLRSCFLPDLSGLHVRIYQFRQLLKLHLPILSRHLDAVGVEPAYVSQWFLSFFAVTCPLPMLFRIYDVIFAEGASETIMRVALSLMRKNEEKLLAFTEIEDVMQLLLSRGLWDVYHYNADEFVSDFVSMTGVVTREALQQMETAYHEAQVADAVSPSENVGTVATRFLGRLWAGSNISTKSASLSPGLTAPPRPVSFLRRSSSKQSLSTLNSVEGGTSDSMLSISTDATSISRNSSNMDTSSVRAPSSSFNNPTGGNTKANADKNLHSQIEDLLMALSEMQRDHAILATQLQKEREEREEDKVAVRSLLNGLRKKTSLDTVKSSGSAQSLETVKAEDMEASPREEVEDDNIIEDLSPAEDDDTITSEIPDSKLSDLSYLLDIVETRFAAPTDNRRSSLIQSKSQLREELARAKEQLINEVSKSQNFSRQISEQQQEMQNLRDQVKEGHMHIRNAHTEKQRLERTIYDLRAKTRNATASPEGPREQESEWPQRGSGHAAGGLRELKLGRSGSNRSQAGGAPVFSKRTSSLTTAKENEPLSSMTNSNSNANVSNSSGTSSPLKQADNIEIDALVLELVQAKTAEAIARQEAEEARGKLEGLRKLLGMSGNGMGQGQGGEYPMGSGMGMGHRSSPSQPVLGTGGFGGLLGQIGGVGVGAGVGSPATPATAGVGGFWGGWGKRGTSGAGE